MDFKSFLSIFIWLNLAFGIHEMKNCTKGAALTDGGKNYNNLDDCLTKCYCAEGGYGPM